MPDRSIRYSFLSRAFHWSVALLVLLMIPAGAVMIQDGLPQPVQNTLFILHKNTGLLVLALVLLRLVWRQIAPPPPLPDRVPGWQRRVADLNHRLLYLLLVLMPVAGYVRVKAGGFPIETLDAWGVPALVPESEALATFAKSVHYYGALALGALIGLHLLAALYHGAIRRDGVVARMWA
ncbi:cytochrome b561 [Rhodovulum sp. ES.010]|uniref:cytochrome b n=1 Tax=Rhodovulum sp. ES.010 TaxID=1882821 RepID=UPI000925E597|nr:cytochrome b/b6 domain-containing protein [Rhodovulum sp. ES.010]SIO54488.1 cytochrome b561 [Rhodovulum sp. ES.010]